MVLGLTATLMASRILQKHEEYMYFIERANIPSLITENVEMGIISQAVKKTFESLDQRVPCLTKIRYLLLCVSEQVENNPKQWERWLKVLSKHGVPRAVVDKMRLSYDKYCLATSSQSAKGTGDDCQRNYLSECHLSALTEQLAGYSHKWRDIGLSLNLPHSIRENIMAMMHVYSGKYCLSEILREWISGNHEHAKPPTLEKLQEALASEIVGLGKESKDLYKILCVDDELPQPPKRCHLDVGALEITRQTRDTVVTEGCSTLLEVQATGHDQSLSYQWIKDGKPLSGDDYSFCHKSTLCINCATLSSQGTYTCQVRSKDNVMIESEPIGLRVDISPYKKVLVDMYSAKPEVPKDSWPPATSNTYINLALIKSGDIDKDRYTIRGDMDDVYSKKENICYADVFAKYRSRVRLLIEGRPGSGKTTLVHKVSKDWARGVALRGAKLVFLISLRVLSEKLDDTLSDILNQLFYRNDEETLHLVLRHIVDSNGEGVCFIIDGLDEYTREKSIIFDIIDKTYLPLSMVIVASRPVALAFLREQESIREVEVLGFKKEQIFEYIDDYFLHRSTVNNNSLKLKTYLGLHLNIFNMCYLPVHIVMICFLFEIKSDLPQTETGIYKLFTVFTLLRKMRRTNKHAQLKSPDDLTGRDKEYFQAICKLAFDMTTSFKQVVHQDEIALSDHSGSDEPSLGLITIDSTAGLYGFQDLYTFFHLTFQEFLAAYHLVKLKEEEQSKIFEKYVCNKHMAVVWKFYCGLVEFNTHESSVKELIGQFLDLPKVQYVFESQQPKACDYVVKSDHRVLNFRGYLNPSDLAAIKFVISNATCPLEELDLFSCRCDCEALAAVLHCCGSLQKLDLSENYVGVAGIMALADGLTHCSNLHDLNLSNNDIGPNGTRTLVNAIKTCINMQKLDISNNDIGPDGAKVLAGLLKKFTCLQELNLSVNDIGDDGVRDLSAALVHSRTLVTLQLSYNDISADGIVALAGGLNFCHSLQHLDLSNNDIGADGMKTLANVIKNFEHLRCLDLSDNDIGVDGIKALTDVLKCCKELQQLNLSQNYMNGAATEALALGLKYCSNVQELNLSHNSIGSDCNGAKLLAAGLRHCKNLQTLYLTENQFSSSDPNLLSDALGPNVASIAL